MRLPIAAALLLSLFAVPQTSQRPATETAPLRLISTAWPPFTNEPGQPRFALDLVEAALGRIGLTAKTTIVEPARFTPALLSNTYDGSAAAWKDAERERLLIFSQPYLENRLILVGRKDEDVSAGALSDLKGKRIAIVEGYAYGDDLEKSGAILVRSRGEEDSLTLVLQSKADYVLMDDLVVQYIVNNYPNEAKAKLSIGTKPLVRRPLYFAVRRARPDAVSIISQFNAQLRGMIADRTYHKLLHVPWISADIDGVVVTYQQVASAPDLFALQTKLHLLMDFEAVESDELRAIVADVDRLAAMSADFDPAKWLTDFEAAGGGFIIRDGGVVFVIPTLGEIGTVQQLIDALDRCPDDRAAVIDRIHQRDRSTISEEEGGN